MYTRVLVKNPKVKKKNLIIPLNINLEIKNLPTFKAIHIYIENKDTKDNDFLVFPIVFEYTLKSRNLIFDVAKEYENYKASKMLLYTLVSKLNNVVQGISAMYKGTVNLQGLGFSVSVTKLANSTYSLFFRFGFKDKCTYITPKGIYIENAETAKTKLIMLCMNLELLKKVQNQIRELRRPKAFKLQGIYLNDYFPKVKKFVK